MSSECTNAVVIYIIHHCSDLDTRKTLEKALQLEDSIIHPLPPIPSSLSYGLQHRPQPLSKSGNSDLPWMDSDYQHVELKLYYGKERKKWFHFIHFLSYRIGDRKGWQPLPHLEETIEQDEKTIPKKRYPHWVFIKEPGNNADIDYRNETHDDPPLGTWLVFENGGAPLLYAHYQWLAYDSEGPGDFLELHFLERIWFMASRGEGIGMQIVTPPIRADGDGNGARPNYIRRPAPPSSSFESLEDATDMERTTYLVCVAIYILAFGIHILALLTSLKEHVMGVMTRHLHDASSSSSSPSLSY